MSGEKAPQSSFEVGKEYTRDHIAGVLGYSSGSAIARGVVTPAGKRLIILFVTENKEADGNRLPYVNSLVGKRLSWEGPRDHFAEQRMLEAKETGDVILIFYRVKLRAAFTCLGRAYVGKSELHTDRPSKFSLEVSE